MGGVEWCGQKAIYSQESNGLSQYEYCLDFSSGQRVRVSYNSYDVKLGCETIAKKITVMVKFTNDIMFKNVNKESTAYILYI